MGLTRSLFNAIGKALTGRRDGILNLFPNWHGTNNKMTGLPWSGNRAEMVNHFRGWNYVAVRAICEEIACMPPQVCRIVDAEEVQEERQKALKGTGRERFLASQRLSRKYLSRGQRMKSLAHVQDSDELEPVSSNHPLVRLLKNPNGPDTAWSFFYKIPLFLELTGNAYIYVVDDKQGKPCQLWNIPSHWVIDQPGDDELIGSYLIRPTTGIVPTDSMGFGGGWFPGVGGQERIDAKRVIKIAYPSSMSLVDGYSPLSATAQWNDVSEYIDQSRGQVFYNGAYPGVVLMMDKEIESPSKEDLDRIEAKFAAKYEGVKRSGRTAILAPGMTMQAFRQTPVELDYVNSGTQLADWQLAARRTPKSIVGLNEQESYASMIATRAGWYTGCIRPKLSLIGQVLTENLAKRFDDDLCTHWPDPTPEEPAARLEKWRWAKTEGLVTDNECRREIMGLDEWEFGGDDPEKAMGKQVVPYATGHDPMDDLANQMAQQGQQPPGGEGGDPLDSMMQEILGDDAPADKSQSTDEPAKPGLPSPLAKRLNGFAKNGVHHA